MSGARQEVQRQQEPEAGACRRVMSDFAGCWHIDRRIEEADGAAARFIGRAVWTPRAGGLDYSETGTLTLQGGMAMQAERRYRWEPDLSVWFEDGRFFHNVPPAGGHTTHQCDPDTYDVRYDFDRWPDFEVTWDVHGPRKSYRSQSLYSRC